MSHSVPSDSSPADTGFLVGTDLVQFDRHDLPIYATAGSLWGEAGHEAVAYGTALDRLYAGPDEVFVASLGPTDEMAAIPATDDPLVVTAGLSDGLILPSCENHPSLDVPSQVSHAPDMATVYDFGGEHPLIVPAHDGWSWDLAKPEWFYDHHI